METRLKAWTQNDELIVEVITTNGDVFTTKLKNGPLFRTKNALVASDPKYGCWVFTEYGAIFSVSPDIKQVREVGEKILFYTPDEWTFAYDMRTGKMIEISHKDKTLIL
jgi:hypothetical protein